MKKLNALMKQFNDITKLGWTIINKNNRITISRIPHLTEDWTGTIAEAVKHMQQNISIATGKW